MTVFWSRNVLESIAIFNVLFLKMLLNTVSKNCWCFIKFKEI
jgi:hypothetical protein